MSQHIFNPEKETSWRAYQESVYSDSEFDGYESILKIRMSGQMKSKAQTGLCTFEFDKFYNTLPLKNALMVFDFPNITFGDLPLQGLEGDFHLDLDKNTVQRFTGKSWLSLEGPFILSPEEPEASNYPSFTYINTRTFIWYSEEGGNWVGRTNLLMAPLCMWPKWEYLSGASNTLSNHTAVPGGTRVIVGDCLFEMDLDYVGTDGLDLLNDPTNFRLSNQTGSWKYISHDLTDNDWFLLGSRNLKLPLHYFDEGRLVGFWLDNPEGDFATSTDTSTLAKPAYRAIAIDEVMTNLSSLRLAGILGATWGYGSPEPGSLAPSLMYIDVVSNRFHLGFSTVDLTINSLHVGSGFPDSGLGTTGDGFLNTLASEIHFKVAGSWTSGVVVDRYLGPGSPAERWGQGARESGHFSIFFEAKWDSDTNSYVDTVVLPSNDRALPLNKQDYVAFWNTLGASQQLNLSSNWPGPWLADADYFYTPCDLRIQSPFGPKAEIYLKKLLFNDGIDYGTITANVDTRFDGGINYHDFYQPIVATYQDLLRPGSSLTEKRLATRASITFPNTPIRLPNGSWYSSTNLAADWLWETSPEDLQDLALVNWWVDEVPIPNTSGVTISRFWDDNDPISIPILASCIYKTSFTAEFPNLTFLDWENPPLDPPPPTASFSIIASPGYQQVSASSEGTGPVYVTFTIERQPGYTLPISVSLPEIPSNFDGFQANFGGEPCQPYYATTLDNAPDTFDLYFESTPGGFPENNGYNTFASQVSGTDGNIVEYSNVFEINVNWGSPGV